MKLLLAAFTATALLTVPVSASAAPCRNAHGKFVKCPPKAKKPVRCKDRRGRFTKCGMPGSHIVR